MELLEGLAEIVPEEPGLLDTLGRVVPVTQTLIVHSPEDFEKRARQAALT